MRDHAEMISVAFHRVYLACSECIHARILSECPSLFALYACVNCAMSGIVHTLYPFNNVLDALVCSYSHKFIEIYR